MRVQRSALVLVVQGWMVLVAIGLASCTGAPSENECGNDVREGTEECDGADLGGASCESLGHPAGELACRESCSGFSLSGCGAPPGCGNGFVDVGETCDGTALANSSCASFGFPAGKLSCLANCLDFDTSGCAISCTPDCSGRQCGPDPVCEASCGGCAGDDVCDPSGQCVSACVPLSASGTAVVDVPTVVLTVDVTLDGAPVTAANTSSTDYGSIVLMDPATGERVFEFPVWDDTANVPTLPYAIRVVQGVYDVRYARVRHEADGAGHWPINANKLLRKDLAVSTDETLTFDIQTVRPSFDVTLDGAPISSSNTADDDHGAITLFDPQSGDEIFILPVWDEAASASQLPWTVTLIPGAYDVHYTRMAYRDVDGGGHWPINADKVLRKDLSITADGALIVDVPTVHPSFNATLDGAPVSSANTADDDYGAVALFDSQSGDEIFTLPVWDETSSASQLPRTVTLILGTYDVHYSRIEYKDADGAGRWPINADKVLRKDVFIATDAAVIADVRTVRPSFDATLDGAPISSANTADDDYGAIGLSDPQSGEQIFTLPVWDETGAASRLPWGVTLIPGTYDVRYARMEYRDVDGGGHWPINANKLLRKDVSITADGALLVDVPTAHPSFRATLDGAPVSSANTASDDYGSIALHDPQSAEKLFTLPVWDEASSTSLLPWVVTVVQGTYDVHYGRMEYRGADAAGHWPINADKIIRKDVSVTADAPVIVDVPTIQPSFDVTLDGVPVSGSNTADDDYGSIALYDQVSGEIFTLPVWDDTGSTSNVPQAVTLIQGTYDVHYGRMEYRSVDGGGRWPLNADHRMECTEISD